MLTALTLVLLPISFWRVRMPPCEGAIVSISSCMCTGDLIRFIILLGCAIYFAKSSCILLAIFAEVINGEEKTNAVITS